MNKKITIFGGAGFIGHNLAIELKKKGSKCQVIDNLEVNNLKSKKHNKNNNIKLFKKILLERFRLLRKNNIKIEIIDLRNLEKFKKKIIDFKPDILIHLAAVSHASISNQDPKYTFDHSLNTLINSLEISRILKNHIIYFSSSMVYGNFKGKKMKENSICKPIGIYGNLKLAGEMMVKSYSKVFNFPYTIIRPSALYGERCVSRRVSQMFIENALEGKNLIINGNGSEKLDFTYINDLVQGVQKIIKTKKSHYETFNITFGSGRKIIDLVGILKLNFPKLKIKFIPWDKLIPRRGSLCIMKAKKLLKYKPEFKIENGYRKYINWYKNFYSN